MKDIVKSQQDMTHVGRPVRGNVIEFERGLTLSTQGTNLAALKNEIGAIQIEESLFILVDNFLNLNNSQRTMTEEQAYVLCVDIVEDYPYESLEDFALMFKMARQGKLSEAYGTIDQSQVYKWIGEYLELKAIDRENSFKQRKIEIVKEPGEPSEALKKLKQEFDIKRKRGEAVKITFEKQNEKIKDFIINCELNPENNQILLDLKKGMINNDTLGGHYDEMIKLINEKLK